MPEVAEWSDASRVVDSGEAGVKRPQDSRGSTDGRDAFV